MQDQQTIQQITSLGLNERQNQIYLALPRHAETTPSELNHLCTQPEAK